MKTITKQLFRSIPIITALTVLSVGVVTAQNTLQFTGVKVTPEKAIQLFWASNTNEVYQIQYANALATNSDGSTAWFTLYDNYPSQGTNTFIGDFGNYSVAPSILHPNQMPMRFYRVVDEGTNAGAIPTVTIVSTTNGATLSGQITVTVAVASGLIITPTLYVDGQQMDSSDDGSNFVINTCEWLNGPHVLFATAKVQSMLSGQSGLYNVVIGRGVSPYVSVNFTNLISGIAFSQPFFHPSLGQTQQVSAIFAANVDWTLQIIDDSSNAVRNASGSGTSLQFNWDGTGDGGTNIPDGVYYYVISAQTNGQSFSMMSGESLTSSFSDMALEDSLQLWAMPADGSSSAVPLALYPPGFDTNDFLIFEASQSDMQPQQMSSFNVASSFSMDASSSYSGSSSENSVAPTRPPTASMKNAVGSIGVAYYDFQTLRNYTVPFNGLPLSGNSGKVQLEGAYGSVSFTNIPEAAGCANGFATRMRKKGWDLNFNLSSSTLRQNNLRSASYGGNEIFGQVNLGLFIDHGSYGTSIDYNFNQAKDTYLPGDNPSDTGAPWLGLSEFGLGGNLRWMAILACNALRDQNYTSMKNQGVFPLKNNTHLLCGASTIAAVGEQIGGLWAEKMTKNIFLGGPETVRQSWYDAGHDQYQLAGTNMTGGAVIFRVAGWDNCLDDKLNNYAGSTSGTLTEDHFQVWP